MTDAYTFGIEEEYFLVDAHTKLVARDMPKTFLDIAKQATNGQVMGEFLQSQIEVATLPHHDIRTAHAELLRNMGLPSLPPARIRPRSGASHARPRRSVTTR